MDETPTPQDQTTRGDSGNTLGEKVVLVCGGRHFNDWHLLTETLERYAGDATIIIHGAANGADKLAGEWAKWRNKRCIEYPADWKRYGRRAGPLRNHQMLENGRPDLVIAFPGGKGTSDMIQRALSAKIKVVKAVGCVLSSSEPTPKSSLGHAAAGRR